MERSKTIIDLTPEEMKRLIISAGEKPFRAKQLSHWLYAKHAKSFNEMTNISAALRSLLSDEYSITPLTEIKNLKSSDGAVKFLFGLQDSLRIETVLIPDEDDRITLCVSSQAGCPIGCRFCKTGKGGFKRNLKHGEIVGQIIHAQQYLGDRGTISNIVFMGMGEPLLNFKNVARALETITSDEGFAMSPSRITVSTSGIVDKIKEFGELGLAELAVSLNASTNAMRSDIMPINKKYPISELLDVCRDYPKGRLGKITFEYVLLADINDSVRKADALAKLLSGIKCKINIIPFNECEGIEYRRPARDVVEKFRNQLMERGFDVYTRTSRGVEISAACGQLSAEDESSAD